MFNSKKTKESLEKAQELQNDGFSAGAQCDMGTFE